MPDLALALIPGHGNRPGRYDPGAVGTHAGLRVEEAGRVRTLALYIAEAARAAGLPCTRHGEETQYRDRQASAVAAHAGTRTIVLLHLHFNAGLAGRGSDYGLVLHDPRSSAGAATARKLAASIPAAMAARGIPAFRSQRVTAAVRPTWDRAANLLEPAWAVPNAHAVLLEPAFLDHPAGVAAVADDATLAALAAGIVAAFAAPA